MVDMLYVHFIQEHVSITIVMVMCVPSKNVHIVPTCIIVDMIYDIYIGAYYSNGDVCTFKELLQGDGMSANVHLTATLQVNC